MSGHRQAAAVLHGLAEEDRAMILAELPAADQATLQAYLRELQELGFERESAAPAAAPSHTHDALVRATAPAMHAILSQEPASLAGQLLALGPWPWAEEFLAQLPAARRELVRTAAKAGRPAPARARFLLDELSHRLSDLRQPPAVRWYAGLVHTLQRRVAQWTR